MCRHGRRIRRTPPGRPLPAPTIRATEKKNFDRSAKTLDTGFPGRLNASRHINRVVFMTYQLEDDFDASVYARAPKLDVAAAITLAILLLQVAPKQAPKAVKTAAQGLRKKTVHLQGIWKQRDRTEKRPDARPIDVMADGAMSRFYSRVEDYAALPEDRYPLAARVRTSLASLFPTRLAFLKGDFQSQWSETEKRLQRIDEEKLAKDLDQAAGPEFLAEVRRIHVLYGEAIGVTKTHTTSTVPGLVAPLRAVLDAMASYGIQLTAVVMDESAKDEDREAARAALKPLDAYRVASTRRLSRRADKDAPEGSDVTTSASDEAETAEATPDTEVPDVPS